MEGFQTHFKFVALHFDFLSLSLTNVGDLESAGVNSFPVYRMTSGDRLP